MAMIYATGPDSELRQVCYGLIQQGLVTDVDRIDQSSLFIDAKGRQKLSSVGIVMVMITKSDDVKAIFDRLRKVEGVRAYAVPVLAAL